MRGRTPARFRIDPKRSGGFSFVEIVIVITIMAAVVGVVGSLMAGYIRMFNETEDQSVAKRRATDVFNIMNEAIVSSGIGIPADQMGWYFSWPSSAGSGFLMDAPISTWNSPIDIRNSASYDVAATRGDMLQVVYSTPTGWKTKVLLEMEPSDGTIIREPTGTYDYSTTLASGYLEFAQNGAPAVSDVTVGTTSNLRNFYTVPDAFSIPMCFASYSDSDKQARIHGRPRFYSVSSDIPMATGEVSPYSEVHRVKALIAYVDAADVFHAAEITDTNLGPIYASNKGHPGVTNAQGLRVEGVKAIRFETNTDPDLRHKILTMTVLAEGDIVDQMRIDDTTTRTGIRSRWPEVTNWDESIFYEDFSMTWRTRNYAVK